MKTAVVTGSAGLIGSEACRFFCSIGYRVIGIDNDMRAYFFGHSASTKRQRLELEATYDNYVHRNHDIRDWPAIDGLFREFNKEIEVVIHAAAQPSHDWAAREPFTDFTINANGTLNLLEATRLHAPQAVFIFTSTNKVYGDSPNGLPLVELDERWEVQSGHQFAEFGIDETMSIDHCTHSLFGASKVAADVLVQEYGRYFGLKTGIFRGGCLTGPAHSGAELHGFLAYLVRCAVTRTPYRIFGYKGKQVRDNIHSADLIGAFWQFIQAPRIAEVYNIGGSRHCNVSVLESIRIIKELSGLEVSYTLQETNRVGDHIWYVSDVRKFQGHYPEWRYQYDIKQILSEMLSVATLETPGLL